jgi:hypothetical protein
MKTKTVYAILLACFFAAGPAFAEDEEIVLTTYYPAPYGDYDGLGANSLAIGSNYAIPAVNGNAVIQNSLGIGTIQPFGKLCISDDSSNSAVSLGVFNNMPYIESISKSSNSTKRPLYLNSWGGNVGIGITREPGALLEVGGLINAGFGSSSTYTGSNSNMGLRFFSKGANSTQPNLVHPAGRIYGHSISPGWENQVLAMGVASGWNSFRDMLFLANNGRIYLGENIPAASLGNSTVNIGGDLFASGNIMTHQNSILWANALSGPNGGKIIGRTGHMITVEWKYPPGHLIFHVDKDENPSGTMSKTFVIDHPVDNSRYLVHAAIEGPESAVFYRGEAELIDGKAVILLPDYFEALTRRQGRTVQLTPKGNKPFILSYDDITDNRFTVYATQPNGTFSWEVKAVRADIDILKTEVDKGNVSIKGSGPYTYITDKKE